MKRKKSYETVFTLISVWVHDFYIHQMFTLHTFIKVVLKCSVHIQLIVLRKKKGVEDTNDAKYLPSVSIFCNIKT